MKQLLSCLLMLLFITAFTPHREKPKEIVYSDVYHFWIAYDKITSTRDSALQYKYLDSLFIRKGSKGLKAMMQARNYTAKDYIDAINKFPLFWKSVRNNTSQVDKMSKEQQEGIEKLRSLYPGLKPATIYFTIGALRTNGTASGNAVLIGSELAMADANTVSSEFPETERAARQAFFNSDPLKGLLLLTLHEYVHTQQQPMVHNILSEVIYEGVAEFVSVKASGQASQVPAMAYGRKNNDQVRGKFEQEMFYTVNRSNWLWSDSPNEFGVRDLGYYIGYRLCEIYYDKAADKKEAIRKLIELDYNNEKEIEDFVNGTGFFSAPLAILHKNFESSRPFVAAMKPFANNSQDVDPDTRQISFEFSEALNGHNTGISYGPLGENYLPGMNRERTWSDGNKTWTVPVKLEPDKHYQFVLDNNFRNRKGVPLKPFVVEFKTGKLR